MNGMTLVWGVLFGAIGFGYFLYGRKQHKTAPFLCGIALMIFPYLFGNPIAIAIIGMILSVLPVFIRR